MGMVRWKEGLVSISALFQKKNEQLGWGNAFVNTPRKFVVFSWKFWENQSSLQVWFHNCVQHPLRIPRPKKRTPKLRGFFVDHPCKFHALSKSIQKIPHATTSTCSHIHISNCLDFLTGISWFIRIFWLWRVVNENCMWQQRS